MLFQKHFQEVGGWGHIPQEQTLPSTETLQWIQALSFAAKQPPDPAALKTIQKNYYHTNRGKVSTWGSALFKLLCL